MICSKPIANIYLNSSKKKSLFRRFFIKSKIHPYIRKGINYWTARLDVFIVDFYNEKATHEELLGIINNVKVGSTEVMCHPGYVDDAFAKESSYNRQRETELEVLTDAAIKDAIQKMTLN